jgi:predicted AAA+ superfamily ATPase
MPSRSSSRSACVTVGGRPTIRSYLTLIERVFLVEFLPPWFSNRTKRLIKACKHFGDTGLACNPLRCSAAALDGQRELLGQLHETFVFGEIEKQARAHPERIVLHHLRDKDGYEVDIVVQRATHHASIEVKAASSVREGDFRGLKRLRELLGPLFHSGIVLYRRRTRISFRRTAARSSTERIMGARSASCSHGKSTEMSTKRQRSTIRPRSVRSGEQLNA